jgi:hypothetical protein
MHLRNRWSVDTALSRVGCRVTQTYLVKCPISAIKNHLEGDVGPVLDTREPCCGGHDVDAPRSTVALEVTDDKLIGTRSGVEVTK